MAKLRDDRSNATAPNQVWAMDWMHDELFDGRRLWVLTVVDTWSRVCPVLRVCRSATVMEVIDALEQARRHYGLPTTIRVDQGSQFTSKEFDLWAYANGITLDFSRPGKPTDNAYVESFNATAGWEEGGGVLEFSRQSGIPLDWLLLGDVGALICASAAGSTRSELTQACGAPPIRPSWVLMIDHPTPDSFCKTPVTP